MNTRTCTNHPKVPTDNVRLDLTASPGEAFIKYGGDYCNESVIALTVIKRLGRWSTTAFDYYKHKS